MKQKVTEAEVPPLLKFLRLGSIAILVLVPFHAFLTAWLASHIGFFDIIRTWKEVLLASLILAAGWVVYHNKQLLHDLKKNWVVRLVALYVGFMACGALLGLATGEVSPEAAAYGFAIQARPWLFMLVVIVAAKKMDFRSWPLYFLAPAAIVVCFGLLQLLVLQPDFLRHFGYGPDTLPAYQAVDNRPEHLRIQSTLRGPNPLGAYLAVVMVLLVSISLKVKKRLPWLLSLLATVVVAGASYSRSAWLGALVGMCAFLYLTVKDPSKRKRFGLIIACILVAATSLIILLRNNDTVQNFIFHTDEYSTSARSSNDARATALKSGLSDIYHEPFGRGVGSAGPASVRNKNDGARLSESFFLQTGQETGIWGIVLLSILLGAITRALWKGRAQTLQKVALAVLVGLVVINLVSHAWADDTLAYVLGGLLGLALATKSEKTRYTKA